MADTRAILSTLLFCILWPLGKLLLAIRTILSPFWTIAQFVLLPVTYLVHAILTVLLFPFRLHLLDRFETIYIWLGTAALIGCITGALVFLIFKVLSSAFNIDAGTERKSRERTRSAKEYRAARREKKRGEGSGASSPILMRREGRLSRRGLASQTIMEEESEF